MTPATRATALRAKADQLQRLRHWLIPVSVNRRNTLALRDMADGLEWEILQIEDALETEAERLAPWPVFTLKQLDTGKSVPVVKEGGA